MNFFDYFKETMTTNYFNYKGRASRKEEWSFLIFYMLLILNCLLAALGTQHLGLNRATNLQSFMIVYESLLGFLSLITIIPTICLWIRRCHDMNMSGWMLLIFGIPAFIGLFMPGDTNANKYGQPIE